MPQIGSIQALRAIAALMVAFGHLQHEAASMPVAAPHRFSPTLLDLTGAGVDLFFVISGFVMVYASRDLFETRDAARVFLLRRIARIVPLYWMTTSLFVVTIVLAPAALSSAAPTMQDIVKSYLFIPFAQAGTGIIQPVYKLGWTLNYEMFFYALFAVALILPRRFAVAFIVALFSMLAAIGAWLAPAPGAVAFWTHPIILEFALGAVIANFRIEGLRLSQTSSIALVTLGCASLALTGWLGADFYGPWRPLLWGAPASLIVAAVALGPERAPTGWAARSMIALGDASYAIYLLHPIIIRALRILWDRSGATTTVDPWFFVALALIVITVAASVVFRSFERPATRALQHWLGARMNPPRRSAQQSPASATARVRQIPLRLQA